MNLQHKFIVLDMKKIDPDEFIKSDKPEEVIVGVLAGKYREKPEVFKKVVRKISEIVKSEREVIKYMDGFYQSSQKPKFKEQKLKREISNN
jgi:hypothetical protein